MSPDVSRVLVTGASGFLGVNIVRCLAEGGRMVIATTRSAGGPDALIKNYLEGLERYVDWIKVDVRNFEDVMKISDNYKLEGIIHAAFVTPGPIEIERAESREILTSNLMGTVNALELARRAKARRFVFVSSSGVYGNTADLTTPISEDSPEPYVHTKGFYHISKIASEKLVERYSQLFPLATTSMRLPVVYGPMERPTGSRREMGPIYRLLKLVLTDEKKTLYIKGTKYRSDWTYIIDAAMGLVAGLDAPGPLSPVYNISCGTSLSLKDFLTAIKSSGASFQWREVEDEESADYVAPISRVRGPLSIEKVRRELGFIPKYDPKLGVLEYCEWWRRVSKKGLWLRK